MDPTPKHRVGRRCLLTPELQDKICALIRAGAWDYVAAEANGVSRDTFHDWMSRGRGTSERKSRTLFVQFARAVDKSHAEGRALAEAQAKKIDPKWWLARKFPEWSDHTEEEKASRRIQVGLTDEAATALLGALFPQRPLLLNGHPKADDTD